MTVENQIQAIQAIGYRQPEAQFLRLVALHSGYFVRRQFLRHIGVQRGKRAQDFIDELIGRGHACRELFREDRHLFRLQSKVIYEVLGEEDNRNRREHQPSTVRLRLMGLDFILEHPEYQYLVTQQEKLSYFFEQRGIDPKALPARLFRSNGTLTTHCFPDEFPLFVYRGNLNTVSFVYIDDPQLSVAAFCSYIRHSHRLFQALGLVGLVFVTSHQYRFEIARKAVEQFSKRSSEQSHPFIDVDRLLAYSRLLAEHLEAVQLSETEIDQLGLDLKVFDRPMYTHVFKPWQVAGDQSVRPEIAAEEETKASLNVDFTLTFWLITMICLGHFARNRRAAIYSWRSFRFRRSNP